MRHFFDQSEYAQTRQLTRQRVGCRRHMASQVRTATAVNVELAMLQGFEQRLLGWVEEVQSLDALFATHSNLGLAQPLQIALSSAGVVKTAQKRQVALITAQQNLLQVDQAVDRLLQARQLSCAVLSLDVPPCGGA